MSDSATKADSTEAIPPDAATLLAGIHEFADGIRAALTDDPEDVLWRTSADNLDLLADMVEAIVLRGEICVCSYCGSTYVSNPGDRETIHEHVPKCEKNPFRIELERLRSAIRTHRDMEWDDRCIDDDTALYEALGEPIPSLATPPDGDMAESCARWRSQRACPVAELPPGKMTIRQLEGTVERLTSQRNDALDLLMEWAYDRGVLIHCTRQYDTREKFHEMAAGFGVEVHRHHLTCYETTAVGSQVIVCQKREGVQALDSNPATD